MDEWKASPHHPPEKTRQGKGPLSLFSRTLPRAHQWAHAYDFWLINVLQGETKGKLIYIRGQEGLT